MQEQKIANQTVAAQEAPVTVDQNVITGELREPVASVAPNASYERPQYTSVWQPVATAATQPNKGVGTFQAVTRVNPAPKQNTFNQPPTTVSNGIQPQSTNTGRFGKYTSSDNSSISASMVSKTPDSQKASIFEKFGTFGEAVESQRQRDIAFQNSKPVQIGNKAASYLTGGFGKPVEERGFLGARAEYYAGGILNFPVTIGGFAASTTEKFYLAGRGLAEPSSREAVGGEFVEAAARTPAAIKDTFDFRTPKGFANTALAVTPFALKGAGELRFLGKEYVPYEDTVSSKFFEGEKYPTATPTQTVKLAQKQGFVYSAAPERLAGGKGNVDILTQSQKQAAGLPLSETGGLYAAPRISPQFTGLVKGDNGGYSIGLLPSAGKPGSVQVIKTQSARLPRGVVARGFVGANKFIDVEASTRYPGFAFTSPANELLGKTESEVIVPGGSRLVRANDYGFFNRAIGNDFSRYTKVPTRVPSYAGESVPMERVALRTYKNIGAANKGGLGEFERSLSLKDYSGSAYSRGSNARAGLVNFAGLFGSRSSKSNLSSSGPSLFSGSSSFGSSSKSFGPSPSKQSYINGSLSSFFGSSRRGRASTPKYSMPSSSTSAFRLSSPASYGLPSTSRSTAPPNKQKSRAFFGLQIKTPKKRNRAAPYKQAFAYRPSITAAFLGYKRRKGDRTGNLTGFEIRGL